MSIIEFFKRLFLPSPSRSEEDERVNIELANMPVDQGGLEMKIDTNVQSDNVEFVGPQKTEEVDCPKIEQVTDLIQEEDTNVGQPGTENHTTENVSASTTMVDQAESEKKISLLDDKNYMSMADSLSSLIEEIEGAGNISSMELVEIVKSRLQEGFMLSGAELISEDKEFDAIRHIPVPPAMVRPGVPIERIIEPGIAIDGKVIRKAKVEIKQL